MPSRRSDVLVTEFLRDSLAGGALGVTQLEVMARAVRLLGERQRIAHAKVFKRAKKVLGIKSVRNGFGDGGEWLWRLERPPASPVSKPVSIEDTYAEGLPEEIPADVRARRIPSSWIDGVARLEHHPPFSGIPPHRWRQFLNDCNTFLTAGENWAARAAELGWNAATLFGCRRGPVLSRILVVPVCYGPSRAAGSSNYIEIGQSSNWLRTDRAASLNVGASTQGTSRCLGSSTVGPSLSGSTGRRSGRISPSGRGVNFLSYPTSFGE